MGPINAAQAWHYPDFYSQFLALFGALLNNLVFSERMLPFLFFALLIYANAKITLLITSNVHLAGLSALLSALSMNYLRIFSDLNRNLMALSLSFICLILIANFILNRANDKRYFKCLSIYLLLTLLLFVIAGTQIESFFILSLTISLAGLLLLSFKKFVLLTVLWVIPFSILFLLFPTFFYGYAGVAAVAAQNQITLDSIIQWLGGSTGLFIFVILSIALILLTVIKQRNALSTLVLSWTIVSLTITIAVVFHILPFAPDFAIRPLMLIPIPILFSITLSQISVFLKTNSTFPNLRKRIKQPPFTKAITTQLSVNKILGILSAVIIMATIFSTAHYIDNFLTPYLPSSTCHSLTEASNLLNSNNFSCPVILFHGSQSIWFADLTRFYFQALSGENFAYYGQMDNLLTLTLTNQSSDLDPTLAKLEAHWSNMYYNELIGNLTGPVSEVYTHKSNITTVQSLLTHPILIISPDLYDGDLPFFVARYYVGNGIYLIPPNSLELTPSNGIYGPTVTVVRDSNPGQIRSEYLSIDPNDPSSVLIAVNATSGFSSYNFTDYPSNWSFVGLLQNGDLSYPDNNPKRLDGQPAYRGKDAADNLANWVPQVTSGQPVLLDYTSKKEGVASIKVEGTTDDWGNLALRYQPLEPLNLSNTSSIAVWAKSSEPATFSITLHDGKEGMQTFFDLKANESSITNNWTRFAVNLSSFTSKSPSFNITAVTSIDFFISTPSKNATLWVDDPLLDNLSFNSHFVFKDRVLSDEIVIAYFKQKVASLKY